MADNEDNYYVFYFLGIRFELWYFILALVGLLFIVTYISYRIVFFHGYQVSLDKTLAILQNKAGKGRLIEQKKK